MLSRYPSRYPVFEVAAIAVYESFQGCFIDLRDLPAKNTPKRAISDTPMSTIRAPQNWNQPLSVPAKRKTFAMTAAPNQNTKLPTVSAIRLIGDLIINLRAKMTICSIPTPRVKFITKVKKPMCWAGLEGAGKLVVLELPKGKVTEVKSLKNAFVF